MKKRSRLLLPVIMATLLLPFAACGGDGGEPAASASGGTSSSGAASGDMPTIGITQLVSHPALDQITAGIIARLKEEGYVDGKTAHIDVQNAQGDTSLTSTIAQKFVDDKVDVIAPVTTPSAQAAVKATQGTNIPVVFSGVSDPIAAGLLKSRQKTQANVTGVSNFDPIPPVMDWIGKILPDVATIGVMYNGGEANSVASVNEIKSEAAKRGWKIVDASVTSTNDVQATALDVVGRVDALYVPNDNTVVSALEAVVKAAQDAKIPLFVNDSSSVERGALLAVGHDNFELGRQAGALIVEVLKGKKVSKVTPEDVAQRELFLNKKAADAIGLTLPKEALDTGKMLG